MNNEELTKYWQCTIKLTGYKKENIHIKLLTDLSGMSIIKINTKLPDNNHCKIKYIRVPYNIDKDNINFNIDDECVIIKAPYQSFVVLDPKHSIKNTSEKYEQWNLLWKELEKINEKLHNWSNTTNCSIPRVEYLHLSNGDIIWRIKLVINPVFTGNDIEVVNMKRKLIIKAEKQIDNNMGYSSKILCETLTIPDDVDITKIVCRLEKSGLLILEAPVIKNNV